MGIADVVADIVPQLFGIGGQIFGDGLDQSIHICRIVVDDDGAAVGGGVARAVGSCVDGVICTGGIQADLAGVHGEFHLAIPGIHSLDALRKVGSGVFADGDGLHAGEGGAYGILQDLQSGIQPGHIAAGIGGFKGDGVAAFLAQIQLGDHGNGDLPGNVAVGFDEVLFLHGLGQVHADFVQLQGGGCGICHSDGTGAGVIAIYAGDGVGANAGGVDLVQHCLIQQVAVALRIQKQVFLGELAAQFQGKFPFHPHIVNGAGLGNRVAVLVSDLHLNLRAAVGLGRHKLCQKTDSGLAFVFCFLHEIFRLGKLIDIGSDVLVEGDLRGGGIHHGQVHSVGLETVAQFHSLGAHFGNVNVVGVGHLRYQERDGQLVLKVAGAGQGLTQLQSHIMKFRLQQMPGQQAAENGHRRNADADDSEGGGFKKPGHIHYLLAL